MKLQLTFLCLLQFLLPSLGEYSNHIVPYEEEFTITCPVYHDPPFQPNIYWLLPSTELVTSNYSDDTFQISDYPGANLTIKSTTLDTFGVYYCLAVYSNQTLDKAAVGVNVDVTLWHLKYRSQVTIGLIAAACLLVIMAAFCLISEFRYEEPSPLTVIKLDDPKLLETYENCGISLTDEIVGSPSAEENTKTIKNSSIEPSSNLEENSL